MPPNSRETFAYRKTRDQTRLDPAHHPTVIVGAGPVGLVMALDLASKGHRSIVLDRRTAPSEGSRAICWSKRTLEILGRLGLADRLIARGVTWQRGRVFHREAEVFAFDLLPEAGHQRPAFINLQQFHLEQACIEAALESGLVDIRWGHELSSIKGHGDCVQLAISTPDGGYELTSDWLVACDGSRSLVREALGLGFVGQTFDDQFLICDIRMQVDRPVERWFWFDPPFNPGRSALMHRQADDVWRLDFQIGPDADRFEEMRPENVARRVRSMLGDIEFNFEWISCYRFHCRRLERFRQGRVVFAGDAAHQVSPFGARGGNSGIQDADNLAWKLALVLEGKAPHALLDSYDTERRQAADENIAHSTRSTDFIAPRGDGARTLRDAVLELAAREPLARPLINSGRLSQPTTYEASPLSTPDGFAPGDTTALRPGSPGLDAPRGSGWLLPELGGQFTVLGLWSTGTAQAPEWAARQVVNGLPLRWQIATTAEALSRWGAGREPAVYLIRPDQHVAARWRQCDPAAIEAALARATARL
jgi:3-(3-hydroxy-phenyl)propionate hydroxylase